MQRQRPEPGVHFGIEKTEEVRAEKLVRIEDCLIRCIAKSSADSPALRLERHQCFRTAECLGQPLRQRLQKIWFFGKELLKDLRCKS